MKTALEQYGSRNFRGTDMGSEAYSAAHGFDPGRVADVVSILSPRVHVSRNVAMAHDYLTTGRVKAMRQRITALERYEATGAISGLKVQAFARALRGDPNAVVVDVWMVRAYGLAPWSGTPKQFKVAITKVRRTAGALGWSAADTQAAIWVGARARCGYTVEDTALEMIP
jgi:hypothetical protein